MHFEELWEKCEKTHQEDNPIGSILDELAMKINLYRAISEQTDVPKEELEKVKSRTMGEILLTLTNLSLVENINVFNALNTAQKYRAEENVSKIPLPLRLPGIRKR